MTVCSAPVGPASTDKVSGPAATVFSVKATGSSWHRVLGLIVYVRVFVSISTLNRACSHERKVWLRVSWHHPFKFTSVFGEGREAVDVEFCTCAGRIRHTFPRSIAEHHPTDSPTKRNSTPPPAETMKPVLEAKVNGRLAQLWPAPFCPVLCQPLFFIYVSQTCQKKLSAATDPTYPNGSERKPRTHLLTSKGMVLFARFTGGFLEKKCYKQQGTIQLSSLLPVVHRYRADVSLGRFAKPDWPRATSCSLWFCFRKARGIVFWLVCELEVKYYSTSAVFWDKIQKI